MSEYPRSPGVRAGDRVRVRSAGVLILLLGLVTTLFAADSVRILFFHGNDYGIDDHGIFVVYIVAAVVLDYFGIRLLVKGISRSMALGVGLIGAVLIGVLGFLTAALVALFVWSGISYPDSWGDTGWVPGIAVTFMVLLILAWFCRRLLRGHRHLAMFLRRFGDFEATRQLGEVALGRVGAVWRVVTLDDSLVEPLVPARRMRSLVWLAVTVPIALTVAGLPLLVFANLGDGIHEPAEWWTAAGCALTPALLIVAVPMKVSSKRARRHSHVVVDRDEEVAPTVRVIRRRNRRVLSPRLVVCRVEDPQWRAMVLAMSAEADAVIIDLSMPTQNLVWEVSSLRTAASQHCVFVCHESRVAALASASPLDQAPAARIARLVEGDDVLVYGSDRKRQRRFARSLRNRLDVAVARRRAAGTRHA